METRVQHDIVGHFNPHCRQCGRTVMEIQRMTDRSCHAITLEHLKPVPVKVTLKDPLWRRRA